MDGRRLDRSGQASGLEAPGIAVRSAAVLTALRQAPMGIAIFDREMRYLAASAHFFASCSM